MGNGVKLNTSIGIRSKNIGFTLKLHYVCIGNYFKQYFLLFQIYLILITPTVVLDFFLKLNNSTDPFQIQKGIKTEQFTSVQTMDLKLLKSIAKKQGVGLSSVLLSIFGGGILRFLSDTGRPIPDNLTFPIPQPWPGRPKNFIGNSWNVMFAQVPLNVPNPLERVKLIHSQIPQFYSVDTI